MSNKATIILSKNPFFFLLTDINLTPYFRYKEIESYDYNSPSYSDATGHFTQVVWKSTTKVGAGIATYNDGNNVATYIVARYKPAGNVIGAFEANVMARKAEGK